MPHVHATLSPRLPLGAGSARAPLASFPGLGPRAPTPGPGAGTSHGASGLDVVTFPDPSLSPAFNSLCGLALDVFAPARAACGALYPESLRLRAAAARLSPGVSLRPCNGVESPLPPPGGGGEGRVLMRWFWERLPL